MSLSVELLEIAITIGASIATLTAIIYSWVLLRTHPKTWTLVGMTAFLWFIALHFWNQRYLMWYVGGITSDYVAQSRLVFVLGIITGYILFLIGTYRSGPIFKKKT